MRVPSLRLRQDFFPYEDTLAWTALAAALTDLEARGSLRLVDGQRPVLAFLCRALDRAGLLSPSAMPLSPRGR